MSSYYGIIVPEFWTGPTGRELRASGGKDAQLLALYLATNRHSNMLGLYRLQVEDVHHETGLNVIAIEKAYSAVNAADFATYDAASAFVWVREMARFRLGLKKGMDLDAKDLRTKAVNRLYHALEGNPFLRPFYDRHHKLLHITKARPSVGEVVPFRARTNGSVGYTTKTTTIRRGLKGASKGLVSQ